MELSREFERESFDVASSSQRPCAVRYVILTARCRRYATSIVLFCLIDALMSIITWIFHVELALHASHPVTSPANEVILLWYTKEHFDARVGRRSSNPQSVAHSDLVLPIEQCSPLASTFRATDVAQSVLQYALYSQLMAII